MGLFKKKKRDNDLRYVGTLQDAYRDMSSVNESPTYYSWGQKNSDRIYASHVPHYGIAIKVIEQCGCWYVRVNTADGRSLMIFVEDMYWDKRREDGTIQEMDKHSRCL